MKMELWYDPVYTETGIKLNGYWQREDDIYGFLYPVRRYPLQTWLSAAGSWTGLRQQLSEVSRGEPIELEFHGRELDYADLSACLGSAGEIELCFCPWNIYQHYYQRQRKARSIISGFNLEGSYFAPLKQSLLAIPDEEAPTEWFYRVRTEEELRQAERAEVPCVVVEETLLGSFEQLERLERLTRSLRRPMDAVCCLVGDSERREVLSRYAWQFPRLRMRFLAPEDESELETLEEKYGRPYRLRKQQERYTAAADCIDEFLSRCGEAGRRIPDLIQRQQAGIITENEEFELRYNRKLKDWALLHGDAAAELRALTVSWVSEERKEL